VACFKHGRGRYVLAAMPIGAGSVTRDFLAALLANLNAPSTDTRCFAALDGLAGAPGAPKAGPRDWRGLVRVDLVPYCNRLFYDEVAGDGLGGWDDSGENDLRSLPTGDLMLCGIPFHVIDPRQDDPNEDIQNRIGHPIRSCIVLRGAARPAFPDRVAGIRIGQKLRKLHFLHTATWCGGEAGQPVARYVVHYADGTASELAVRRGVEIDDWTRVAQGNPRDALVAWRGSNRLHPQVGLYLTTWTNPHPEKEIATMDFVSAGAGVPILVAVTGQ